MGMKWLDAGILQCYHKQKREMRESGLKLWESSVNKLRSADILIYKDTITFKHVLSI